MTVGVPSETAAGERRVALVPAALPALSKRGMEILIEAEAGAGSGYPDSAYAEKGAHLVSREEVFGRSDVLLQVRGSGGGDEDDDSAALRSGQTIIGFFDPLSAAGRVPVLAARGVSAFAMELMPRITRAQSMDALSSMATIAGYKAVLLAASYLPRMFPMLMTAAGTIHPAKVFVIGAGVAGLQAIATARRLGAVVSAYDVRPAVRDQVESVGGKFVELPLETTAAEDTGGYARVQDESFYRRQRDLLAKVVAAHDVVITTAAVPGKKAPVLITAEMVASMAPGSVIVDLAVERGGNCELSQVDFVVETHGVTVLGPSNLPSTVPFHASQMYARNITAFLLHLAKSGSINFDTADEIVRETLLCRDSQVVNPRILTLLETQKRDL